MMPHRALPIALLCAALSLQGCTYLSRVGQVIVDPSVPVGAPEDLPTHVAFSINANPLLEARTGLDTGLLNLPQATPANAYGVTLSADDPQALTEKVGALLDYLQEAFPAMSPTAYPDGSEPPLPRSALEPGTPGLYKDPAVTLDLPSLLAPEASPPAPPIALKILQLRDDSLLRNSVYPLLADDPAKALRSSYIRDDDYLLRPGQFKFIPFAPVHADTRFIAVIADYRHRQEATWQQVLRIAPRGRHIVLSVLLNDADVSLREEE